MKSTAACIVPDAVKQRAFARARYIIGGRNASYTTIRRKKRSCLPNARKTNDGEIAHSTGLYRG